MREVVALIKLLTVGTNVLPFTRISWVYNLYAFLFKKKIIHFNAKTLKFKI